MTNDEATAATPVLQISDLSPVRSVADTEAHAIKGGDGTIATDAIKGDKADMKTGVANITKKAI